MMQNITSIIGSSRFFQLMQFLVFDIICIQVLHMSNSYELSIYEEIDEYNNMTKFKYWTSVKPIQNRDHEDAVS